MGDIFTLSDIKRHYFSHNPPIFHSLFHIIHSYRLQNKAASPQWFLCFFPPDTCSPVNIHSNCPELNLSGKVIKATFQACKRWKSRENSINRSTVCKNKAFECTNKSSVFTAKDSVLNLQKDKLHFIPAKTEFSCQVNVILF